MPKNDKQWISRFFSSGIFVLAFLVFLLLLLAGNIRAYYQEYKIKQEIKAFEDQISSLEKKKLESMEILKYVMSSGFVEEQGRTELNLKKPGEKVMVVKGSELHVDRGDAEETAARQEVGNPLKWWYYFIHKDPGV